MKKKPSKGFIALESFLVLLILILLLFYILQTIAMATERSQSRWEEQHRFNTLVSAADYIVKVEAVMGDEMVRYPNWIDETKLDALSVTDLQERLGFSSLSIGFSPGDGNCIYRIVVVGPTKEIRRLFVCGG